ncbi:MAG TPA: hypothetical protein DCZ94_20900 [Lentisphaeria bacterium]|nr:MAG: hypothetical protein A2X48_23105 [Lentisphaerae bacterium GWF2_49_21]HBC89406.1 hypothetical protein [Lentisphaeria bacterium]
MTNLLFIYTDEQAFNTLATYGNSKIQMPNLNRLAGESVVFDQAYVTQPVCTPSRSTLLTGQYPHTNGCTENNLTLRQDTCCLPEMLSKGKYSTGHYGKWHLGDELFAQHGFDEWISIEDNYNEYFTVGRDRTVKSSYHDFLIANGFKPRKRDRFGRDEAARLPEEFGKPAFLAQKSSEFLRNHRKDPFMLFVNFLEPHMPFFGPRDNQYVQDEIPLPANFAHELTELNPTKARLLRENYVWHGHSGLPLKTEADWRRMIAHYWGLCSLIDTHVGTILNTLDDCGLRDNTIVVFTSDHGDMMGSHRLIAKCLMFQEAVRVPMMIRLPGQRKSCRATGPVSQVDVVPTLLDLMGQEIPDYLQGKSLRKKIESGKPISEDDVFIEWNGPNNGLGDVKGDVSLPDWMKQFASPERIRAATIDPVRTVITPDGWKFNCSPLGEHELYNLSQDPLETRNIFKENRELAGKLRDKILNWQEQTGDKIKLPKI